MDPSQPTIARRPTRAATATTPPPHDATPERPQHPAPRRPQPTRDHTPSPAESVRVTDRPAAHGGRAYLIERGLESKAELDALVADYLDQATQLDRPPMLGSADSRG
jgi:hypothetical protein